MASKAIRALVNRFYGGPPTQRDMPKVSQEAIDKVWATRNKRQVSASPDGLLSAYIPPKDRATLKRAAKGEFLVWKTIESGLRSPDPAVRDAAHARYRARGAIEQFRHIQPDDKTYLINRIGVTTNEIEAFQRLLGDEVYDLDDAVRFATCWKHAVDSGMLNPQAHVNEEIQARVNEFVPEIHKRVDALLTVGARVRFVYSEGVDTKKQKPDPRADLAAQPYGAVANADSRAGWGNSGTAAAIQKAQGTDYMRRKKALHAEHANLVGNLPVASNAILEVPAAAGSNQPKVIFNSPGPNHKKYAGLRLPFPRWSHWLRPDRVSEKQLWQLQQANRAPFDGTRYFNEATQWHGKPPLTKVSTIPFSSMKFGFPEETCSDVNVQETVRFAVEHPGVTDITVFTLNTPTLNAALIKRFDKVGVKATKYAGVEKSSGQASPGGLVDPNGAGSDRSLSRSRALIPDESGDESLVMTSVQTSEEDSESLVAGSDSDTSLESPREPAPASGIRSQSEKTRAFVQAFAPKAGNQPLTPEVLDQALKGWLESPDKHGHSRENVIALLSTAFGHYCVETLGMRWDLQVLESGELSAFVRGDGRHANLTIVPKDLVKSGLAGLEAGFGSGGLAGVYGQLHAAVTHAAVK